MFLRIEQIENLKLSPFNDNLRQYYPNSDFDFLGTYFIIAWIFRNAHVMCLQDYKKSLEIKNGRNVQFSDIFYLK